MRTPLTRAAGLLVAALLVPLLVAGPARAATDPLPVEGTLVPAGVPAPPAVTASAWLVADLDSGEVLAAQNPRYPLAPASTLKLLTLLALAPELDREATWTAVHDDAAAEGSKVGIVPDSVYRVDDLLHGLMLSSGNDAAHALAGMVGGMDAATTRMSEVADAVGAQDTVVRNTSGLDAEGQVSTVVDLALIGRAVLEDPALAEVVRTTRYQFPAAGTTFDSSRPTFEIGNKNRLLYGYEGALGLKNGYTNAARSSFVGAVERDGHRYLVSMLRAEGSASGQTRDLLDWAIANGQAVEPVGTLPEPAAEEASASTASPATPSTVAEGDGDQLAAPVPLELPGETGRGLPTWITTLLVILLVLAMAVALLRARVLLLRRVSAGPNRRPHVRRR